MSEIVPVEPCRSSGCKMQARVAIRTVRGSGKRRGELMPGVLP